MIRQRPNVHYRAEAPKYRRATECTTLTSQFLPRYTLQTREFGNSLEVRQEVGVAWRSRCERTDPLSAARSALTLAGASEDSPGATFQRRTADAD